jgi:hypothetical protein
LWENQKKGNHEEDIDVDERTVLKCILEIGFGVAELIDLGKGMDGWQAVLKRQ